MLSTSIRFGRVVVKMYCGETLSSGVVVESYCDVTICLPSYNDLRACVRHALTRL